MKIKRDDIKLYSPTSSKYCRTKEIDITKEEEAWIYKVFSDLADVQSFIYSKLFVNSTIPKTGII